MAFEDSLSRIGGVALQGGTLLAVLLVVIGVVVGGMFLYFRWKRYKEYRVVVWEYDGAGHLKQKYDEAGVFVDGKTNNKRFFMKAANVGLSPDNIPYIEGPQGSKYVYVLRFGLKNYCYIRPEFDEFRGVGFLVGEEDVNWATNAYERQKNVFKFSTWQQYLPFIALALVSIIILVIFIYFFRDFAVLRDVATALKEAAATMQAVNSNTTIIPA